jgi:hypothetical protein
MWSDYLRFKDQVALLGDVKPLLEEVKGVLVKVKTILEALNSFRFSPGELM